MKQHRMTASSVLAILVTFCLRLPLLQAEIELPEGFEPSDPVESVEFTLQVGGAGDPLSEPVALDLGLGFPFWLSPLGSDEEDRRAVGALPQVAPEAGILQPGDSATFRFQRESDHAGDQLRYTSQLLDGVRISDITRVGITSRGRTDWELNGYRLVINGKAFAARDDVHQRARTSVEQSEIEWVEVRESLAADTEERDDLMALEEAGLATDEDLSRLEELRSEIRPLEDRIAWHQGVSIGALPWFVEEGLEIPGRSESSPIATARVFVTTAPHTNAATYNYIYFRTGGKKYFLYPAQNHFTPNSNPQEFELQLLTGPLAAGDVRGFSLGMLAHDQPYADASDRWHPQRLIVELDGRSVYDSDSAVIDRQSLEVVRLIPPAHLDADGNVRLNEANPRECFVWTAGQAQGLDLENGGAVDLGDGGLASIEPEPPDQSQTLPFDEDPGFSEPPLVESPNVPDSDTSGGVDLGVDGDGSGCWPGESPMDVQPWPDYPSDAPVPGGPALGGFPEPWPDAPPDDSWEPFPGEGDWESPLPEEQNPSVSADPSWWGFGIGPDGIWAWGGSTGGVPQDVFENAPTPEFDPVAWDAFVAWMSDLVDTLLVALGPTPEPIPVGEPPQVHDVHLLRNPDDPSQYQVIWDISGDYTEVAHCNVILFHVKPEYGHENPDNGTFVQKVVATQTDVTPEIRVSEWLTPEGSVDPAGYIQPVVLIQTLNEEGGGNWPQIEVGASLPWLMPDATAANQPRPDYAVQSPDLMGILDAEPAVGEAGVWTEPLMRTADATSLATGGITSNVAVQDTEKWLSTSILFRVDQPLDSGRKYELIGHAGLLDPPAEGANYLSLHVRATLQSTFGAAADDPEFEDRITLYDSEHRGGPQLIRIPIDPSAYPDRRNLVVVFKFGHNPPSPTLPAIYGLRLVPVE